MPFVIKSTDDAEKPRYAAGVKWMEKQDAAKLFEFEQDALNALTFCRNVAEKSKSKSKGIWRRAVVIEATD